MLNLYTYRQTEEPDLFNVSGSFPMIERTLKTDIVNIGQRSDYSEYLVLSSAPLSFFKEFDGDYSNWDFNYCQEWGLGINDDVIKRVKKELRIKALNSLTIQTSSGNIFDGNESARNNMLAAISASKIFGTLETNWKLANNTVVSITLQELEEALALSIKKVGETILD